MRSLARAIVGLSFEKKQFKHKLEKCVSYGTIVCRSHKKVEKYGKGLV